MDRMQQPISAHPKGAGGPILRLHSTFDMAANTNSNCSGSLCELDEVEITLFP